MIEEESRRPPFRRCSFHHDNDMNSNLRPISASYSGQSRAEGFTVDELWQLNLNGLNAAFLEEGGKSELRREWDAFKEI